MYYFFFLTQSIFTFGFFSTVFRLPSFLCVYLVVFFKLTPACIVFFFSSWFARFFFCGFQLDGRQQPANFALFFFLSFKCALFKTLTHSLRAVLSSSSQRTYFLFFFFSCSLSLSLFFFFNLLRVKRARKEEGRRDVDGNTLLHGWSIPASEVSPSDLSFFFFCSSANWRRRKGREGEGKKKRGGGAISATPPLSAPLMTAPFFLFFFISPLLLSSLVFPLQLFAPLCGVSAARRDDGRKLRGVWREG